LRDSGLRETRHAENGGAILTMALINVNTSRHSNEDTMRLNRRRFLQLSAGSATAGMLGLRTAAIFGCVPKCVWLECFTGVA
jgi:hypothetical protein